MSLKTESDDQLDRLIISEYPYPIAVNYQRLLNLENLQAKTSACIQVFEVSLRFMALTVVCQYLLQGTGKITDPYVNELLLEKFPRRQSLGTWQQLLFSILRAYEGNRELFFIPELYDFYWETNEEPHRPQKDIEQNFNRLLQIRNDLAHRSGPTDEDSWVKLFTESYFHLRNILNSFSFLKNYQLVRLLSIEKTSCIYEVYKGQEAIKSNRSIPESEALVLHTGWFYLAKLGHPFFSLHPLVVFPELKAAESVEKIYDAAIFEGWTKNNIDYFATVLMKTVRISNPVSVQEFASFLYDTIERYQGYQTKEKTLNWAVLKESSQIITQQRVRNLRGVYRPSLYTRRKEPMDQVQNYLASEKSCLVISGKSGVGKTSFFFSLVEEYANSHDICVLMYNGAGLNTQNSLSEIVSQDFSFLTQKNQTLEVNDVFKEINKIEGMKDRKFLLLIDGINENPDSKQLLRQIDNLVKNNIYPWLKVIINSRPESWRLIQRGLPLTLSKYYRESQSDMIGLELETFELNLLTPFTNNELQVAYTKYQQEYLLLTDFNNISFEVKQILRDPLTLKFLAEIYKGQQIPANFDTGEILEHYLQNLVNSQRLASVDLQFLVEDLMPLFINKDRFDNSINIDQIDPILTVDGRPLRELIFSQDILSNGRRVNQSYLNLVDAEILCELRDSLSLEIAFRFSRFYDYFGGAQLYSLLSTETDKFPKEFERITEYIQAKPFLWGVIEQALLIHFQKISISEAIHLIQQFTQTDNRFVADLTSEAVENLAGKKSSDVRQIVAGVYNDPSSSLLAIRIALGSAQKLGFADILEKAALHKHSSVRRIGQVNIYKFWRRDHEAGMHILERLSSQTFIYKRLPKQHAFESLIILSLVIISEGFQDQITLQSLKNIWINILEILFWAKPRSKVLEILLRFIREIIVQSTVMVFVRATILIDTKTYFSIPEINQFFKKDSDNSRRKMIVRKLAPYVEVDRDGLPYIKETILNMAATGERDLLLVLLSINVLYVQSIRRPEAILRFLSEIFEAALRKKPLGPFCTLVPISVLLFMTMDTENSPEVYFQALSHMVTTIWKTSAGKWSSHLGEKRETYFVEISRRESRSFNAPLSSIAINQLDQIIQSKDYVWIIDILERDLLDSARQGEYVTVLSSAQKLVEILDASVEQALVNVLRVLGNQYSDEVEEFLEKIEDRPILKLGIKGSRPEEFLGNQSLMDILRFYKTYIIHHPSEEVQRSLSWLWFNLADCPSFADWLVKIIKVVVNLVYGERIFQDNPLYQISSSEWHRWEDQIKRSLIQKARVSAEDLPDAPKRATVEIFNEFLVEYLDLDLEIKNNDLVLGPQAARSIGVIKSWSYLAQAISSDAENRNSAINEFLNGMSQLLGVRTNHWPDHSLWVGGSIIVSKIFHDIKLPDELLFVFKRDSVIRRDDFESLQLHMTMSEPRGNVIRVALLGVFEEFHDIKNISDLLRAAKLEQVYGITIIPVTYNNLFSLIASRDPAQALKRLVLSNIDLPTISPFTTRGPTSDNMFFGRERELRMLATQLRSSSFAIIGGRRIGKTSLLLRLHRVILPTAGFYTLFLDCSKKPSDVPINKLRLIDWRPEPPKNPPKTFGELLESPPFDRPVVLLLDEADKLIPFEREHGWQLINGLRSMANTGYVQVVFCGERVLIEVLRDSSGPLFNFANEIQLGLLEEKEVHELVTRPMRQLEIALNDEDKIVERIWEFTSGHPNVVQLLCHRLIERINQKDNRTITLEDVDIIINNPEFLEKDFLQTFWEAATPLEKIITLVLSQDELKPYKYSEVRQMLSQAINIQIDATLVKDALDRLIHLRSILQQTKAGYEFAVPAFPRVLTNTTTMEDLLVILVEEFQKTKDKG